MDERDQDLFHAPITQDPNDESISQIRSTTKLKISTSNKMEIIILPRIKK